jgi:ArsR family transcriptional regulator, arsenate/arsenite/antimonite-responsive transcriptional repressor
VQTFTLISALPMENLASYFKGLADEKRLRILNLLFQGELCGCDIQLVLEATQSNVSRHLSYLKNAGLITDRRVANRVYYSLAQKDEHGMEGLFTFLQAVFGKNSILQKDRKKLLAAIKDGSCSVSEAPAKEAPSRPRRQALRTAAS